MATTASTTEQKESRDPDKGTSSSMVIVELDEPQSAVSLHRLRKGKGKLFHHIETIMKDLVEDGTVKPTAQPVVIVVQEIPGPPWAFMDDDD